MAASSEEIKQPRAKPTYSRSGNRAVENKRQYTADKEVCCRRSYTDDPGSTTDGSVEYVSLRIVNGQCCPCCCDDGRKSKRSDRQRSERKAPVSKYNLEVQTSRSDQIKCPPVDSKHTQTPCVNCKTVEVSAKSPDDKLIKLGKKKVICLCVCCCPCSKQDAKSPGDKKTNNNDEDDETRCSKCQRKRKFDPDEQLVPEKQTSFTVNKAAEKETPLNDAEHPRIPYNTVIPPPNTKAFSKFGTPSKSYSWMKGATSENTDSSLSQYQFYKSPLTGKTYDLSSVNIDEQFKLTLPDAIDVTDDLVYLKQLDKSWKSDKESRLVLDAVCDAIMSEHEDNIKKERVDELLLNDERQNLKDWTKAGYEVRKLNNIFDEIFSLVPPSDNERVDNAFFAASGQGHSWKPDALIKSVPSLNKPQKTGKKRSLNQNADENSGKKLKSDDQSITAGEGTKTSIKIDDIFSKIETTISKHDTTTEKDQTLSQTNFSNVQDPKSLQSHSKTYPMSSDIAKNDLTLFEQKPNVQEAKKSYEIFSSDRNAYVAQEESTVPSDTLKGPHDVDNIISEELLQINRLSVQSFLVCDMKSSETRNSECDTSLEKKASKKKQSKSSLIPIRRRKH